MTNILKDMLQHGFLRKSEDVYIDYDNLNTLAFFSDYENAWVVHPIVFLKWYRATVGYVHYRHFGYDISCEFATNRISTTGAKYLHTGLDRTDKKNSSIHSPFAGVVSAFSNDPLTSRGISIDIVTSWSNNEIIYRACHLAEIKKAYVLSRVKAGEIIGRMGNTGRCMTYTENSWRELTDGEKNDPTCQRGVHLHEMILLRDLINISR